MFTSRFVKRLISVVSLLIFVLILTFPLPCTAEGGVDSSSIELNEAVSEDTFVLIDEGDVPILPDLSLDLTLDGDASNTHALDAVDEAIEANGLPKALTLGIKESYTLNVKKATFKSSKPSIAIVNKKGVITAKKKGTTKITVKSGKKTVGTCKITVVDAPKNVELDLSAVQLGVKEELQLKPTITEGSHASFTYTAENKKIATVSKAGVVTARKVGSTTVTVKTHNGKKASLKVTVKKAPAKVTLEPTTLELEVGQAEVLAAKLPRKTASFSMSWASDNEEVATVDENGAVTAIGSGTANITVKTFNDKKASCAVTVAESATKLKLLYPTNLYQGDIFDDAIYPLYGEDDITLVWTAVKGAVRYDLVIKRYGYTGDGCIFYSIPIDPPKDDGATVTFTLKKDYLDGFDVQDRMGLALRAFDGFDNEYASSIYSFRWIRDFNSLEYDFYYARNGKNDFISFPDGSGKITGVVLTRYYGKNTQVRIPTTFGGYPVRALNQTFMNNKRITEVVIPDGITEIGLWAFEDCSKLSRVVIQNSVSIIGQGAFSGCSALTEISIPDSVKTIYDSAFNECTSLTTIYGVKGSYAQTWAEEHGYTFVDLGN